MSPKDLADTGKSNRYLRRRLLFSLDTLTEVHLAGEPDGREALLLQALIFDLWVIHGTHHSLFRLHLCVSLGELDSLLFWESRRMVCAFETIIVLVVNKKINQRDGGHALAFNSKQFEILDRFSNSLKIVAV